jgi:ubiquinone biosynthesis protein UbiJ
MSANFQLKPLLISVLETGLNNYLRLDPQVERLLAPIVGKVIAIHITQFNETLYLCPHATGIQCLDDYQQTADATLSGSLAALGLMGLSTSPMHALFKGSVRIDGNPEIARKVQNLFGKLDINLEAQLARFTGEQLAQRLSTLVRFSRHWSQNSVKTFRLNLQEFLQEETRDLPAKPEAELFFQQVDTCRSDFDRLQARLERLNNLITPAAQSNS